MGRLHRLIGIACALGGACFLQAMAACSGSGGGLDWPRLSLAGSQPVHPALAPRRTSIAIAPLRDPARPSPAWKDVGDSISQRMTDELRLNGMYHVRAHIRAQSAIETALAETNGDWAHSAIASLQKELPGIDTLITGRVTDFNHHTPGGRAVVAIDLEIIDLSTREVTLVDHILGTASSNAEDASTAYRGLSVSAFEFRSTPLGKAMSDAVARASERVVESVLPRVDEVAIARRIAPRKVEVHAGRSHGLREEERFYLVTRDRASGAWRSVIDPVTQLPVRAFITDVGSKRSKAWLMGEPPHGTEVLHARLMRTSPREMEDRSQHASASQAASPSVAPGE